MLFKVFALVGALFVFGGIAATAIGRYYHRRRINKGGSANLNWSHGHQFFVVAVFGGGLAVLFVMLTSAAVNYWAARDLMSMPGTAVIAERIGIPSDQETVRGWTQSTVCKAYLANDDVAISTRRSVLNNLVIGNETEYSISDDNVMVKVIANAARLEGLDAAPRNFVAMLEYSASGGTCLDEDVASCEVMNTRCGTELTFDNSDSEDIVTYLKGELVPPLFAWSLFGADNVAPKPRQIRYRMFSAFEGDLQSVVGRYAAHLEGNPALSNEAIPVIEAYLDVMIEVVADQRRILALVWGPIQLITLALFFGAMILAAERICLIRDAPNGLHNYLVNKKAAGGSLERVRIHFQEVVYAPINYIIWALPTLGFIGTVTGISAAIADAYKVAENMGPVAQGEAIEGVTTLLGIAFDTTFIALVCSLPLMGLVTAIKARETRMMDDMF